MLCMVAYRPYSDHHSRVRGSNRASHIPRVRGSRRGYAMATLHAYSSDPRALLVLADFAPSEQTTAAVRLKSTGAPHRSKGAFHTYRWAFSPGAEGRVDVGHVQLVIRLSRRPPLRELPWRGCSVPASRTAFRNACERVICRSHAHSRAPARAGPAPSRDRPVPAHPERQPGAHTRARPRAWCRWPLWRVPAAA